MNTFEFGWLSPEGKFYTCGYMEHLGYAHELREKLYPNEPDNLLKREYPCDFLLARGWIELTRFAIGGHKYVLLHDKKLSPEQHHYLKPIIEDNWDDIDDTCKFDLAEEFDMKLLGG